MKMTEDEKKEIIEIYRMVKGLQRKLLTLIIKCDKEKQQD